MADSAMQTASAHLPGQPGDVVPRPPVVSDEREAPDLKARRRRGLRLALFLGVLAVLFYGGSVLYIIFGRGQV